MTEFRSPAVALSIIRMSALISTSENDGVQTDSGNERRKVNRESDRETKRADRCGRSYFFSASLNGDYHPSSGFAPGILIS